jgi:hypothetical protein
MGTAYRRSTTADVGSAAVALVEEGKVDSAHAQITYSIPKTLPSNYYCLLLNYESQEINEL